MTTANVTELKRLSPHGTTTGADDAPAPADHRPTPEEARRAALHERQVAQVRASLLRGIT